MITATRKVTLPDGTVVKMTLAEHAAFTAEQAKLRTAQAEAAEKSRADALRKRGGAFKIILTTPDSVEQVFASDDESFPELVRLRLAVWMEQQKITSVTLVAPEKIVARVVSVMPGTETYLKPGDVFRSWKQVAKALCHTNPLVALAQAENKGKKSATVSGIEFCREENYHLFSNASV
jgi:hypothetical protein